MKLWRIPQQRTEVEILISKTLAIAKMVHLLLIKYVPSSTITQLDKVPEEFIKNL